MKASLPASILEQLASVRKTLCVEPVGNGHIHDTYLLKDEEGMKWILQRINTNIFTDVEALHANLLLVSSHLQSKQQPGLQSPILRPEGPGGLLLMDDEHGNHWRCLAYIPNAGSYEKIETTAIAREAGKALGRLIDGLSDLDYRTLKVVLPDFHDLASRMQQLEEAWEKATDQRRTLATEDMKFARAYGLQLKEIPYVYDPLGLPVRITHNDPKINNILFDEEGRSLCLIDMDTVMPGYLHHDFGDAIRTGAATADEDEPDTTRMQMDLRLFEAYAEGLLMEMTPTAEEQQLMPLAPQIMTYIIAIRFLADYLRGDTYYKVAHENHNLQRWRAQRALLLSMQEQYDSMKHIIMKLT